MKIRESLRKGNKNVAAILLAGGSGRRAGGFYKQFFVVDGKSLILYSLEKFLEVPIVDMVIIAVPSSRLKYMNLLLKKVDEIARQKVRVIAGGINRRESAFRALQYITDITDRSYVHVFFHDATRPMISVKMIKKLHTEALFHGASTLGVPAIDALLKVRDGFIENVVNKASFYYGFTPQCLPLTHIWHAHRMAIKKGMLHEMDNIELLRKFSKKVNIKILDNFYPNIKMTYKEDVKLLEPFLSGAVK